MQDPAHRAPVNAVEISQPLVQVAHSAPLSVLPLKPHLRLSPWVAQNVPY